MKTETRLQSMGGSGKTSIRHALDAADNAKTMPTHTMYTTVWNAEGDKFNAWLPIGSFWRDDRSGFIGDIHSEPVNREETATFHCLPVGAPPPQPLTMTREQFIEQQQARHDE